jgi:hypothetical protein
LLKLYRLTDSTKEYWECWEEGPGSILVHWGELGTEGQTKRITSGPQLQEEADAMFAEGFAPVDPEDHSILLIEYAIDGFGTPSDLDKRHRLENRMNETLGWTGLGACDGGSIGSGTMEVCNFVVDFDIARQVIESDLQGTEFSDYSRIYREELD